MALKVEYDFVTKFLADQKGSIDLTHSRTSVANFTDWEGISRTVQANEARFTGARRVENLSDNTLADVTWSKSDCTLIENDTTAPDGSNTGFAIQATTQAGIQLPTISDTVITVPRGGLHTFSLYVKKDSIQYITFAPLLFATGSTNVFDLDGLTWTSLGAEITNSGYTDEGDGWYRIWVTQYITDADLTGRITIGISELSTLTRIIDPTTADRNWVWGLQIENVSGQADPSPSEYIPTTTAAVAQLYNSKKDGTALATAITGLLHEAVNTQLLLQSSNFTTTWVNAGANTTFTAGAGYSGDGTQTGTDILHNDAAEDIVQAITTASGNYYTVSAYVTTGLTGAHDWVYLKWNATGGTNGIEGWFDISTGSMGTQRKVGTGTYSRSKMEALGNGVYRISVSGRVNSGVTATEVTFMNVTADGGTTSEATNSVIWSGLNITNGPTPLEYIPSTTATVTLAGGTSANTSPGNVVTQATGTFYYRGQTFNGGTNGAAWYVSAGAPDYIYMGELGAMTLNTRYAKTSTIRASLTSAASSHEAYSERVFSYAQDDFEQYVDGVRTGTGDQAGDVGAGYYTKVSFGAASTGAYLPTRAHYTAARWYDTRLTDAQLEDMSNGIFPTLGSSYGRFPLGQFRQQSVS